MRICLIALACCVAVAGQNSDADYKVYTEHPRLLLKAQRLRLLKRERERTSPRWVQFETLMRGKAQMPEPAFALSLFYQVTGEEQFGKQAIQSALQPSAPVREVALAYDWCAELLSPSDKAALEKRLRQSLASASPRDFAVARDRAFAAIALGEGAALRQLVVNWWRGGVAPALTRGDRQITHPELYHFMELLHAVRDNLQIDLRDDILPVFKDLAVERVLGYYPAVWPAAENEYRIPWFSGKADPDLRVSALNRVGEMALVAYENNAQESQFLQGWLMHDRFVLRGPFGVPYEFLWANPYQPGLPYEKLPLRYYNPRTGTLFLRSSWNDDATWIAWFGASGQMFSEGRIGALQLKKPLEIGDAMLLIGDRALTKLVLSKDSPDQWYVVGLKAQTVYDIESAEEGMTDAKTDRAGILSLQPRRRVDQPVFVHEPRKAAVE